MSAVKNWLDKHKVQYRKDDVAQWGSYTLLISFDGQTWLSMRRFGGGFEVEHAAEIALKEALPQFNQNVISWMGMERFEELKTAILESNNESSTVSGLPN